MAAPDNLTLDVGLLLPVQVNHALLRMELLQVLNVLWCSSFWPQLTVFTTLAALLFSRFFFNSSKNFFLAFISSSPARLAFLVIVAGHFRQFRISHQVYSFRLLGRLLGWNDLPWGPMSPFTLDTISAQVLALMLAIALACGSLCPIVNLAGSTSYSIPHGRWLPCRMDL